MSNESRQEPDWREILRKYVARVGDKATDELDDFENWIDGHERPDEFTPAEWEWLTAISDMETSR